MIAEFGRAEFGTAGCPADRLLCQTLGRELLRIRADAAALQTKFQTAPLWTSPPRGKRPCRRKNKLEMSWHPTDTVQVAPGMSSRLPRRHGQVLRHLRPLRVQYAAAVAEVQDEVDEHEEPELHSSKDVRQNGVRNSDGRPQASHVGVIGKAHRDHTLGAAWGVSPTAAMKKGRLVSGDGRNIVAEGWSTRGGQLGRRAGSACNSWRAETPCAAAALATPLTLGVSRGVAGSSRGSQKDVD